MCKLTGGASSHRRCDFLRGGVLFKSSENQGYTVSGNIITDVLFIVSIFIPFVVHVTPYRGVAIYLIAIMAPLIGIINVPLRFRANFFGWSVTSIFSLFLAGGVLGIVKNSWDPLLFSYSTLVSLIIAVCLLAKPRVALIFSFILLVFAFLWYGFSVLKVGHTSEEANSYLTGLSRNHVSFYLLIVVWFYYAVRISRGAGYSILPVLMMCISSLQLYGRSGIALSFCTAILVLCHSLLSGGSRIPRAIKISLILIFGVVVLGAVGQQLYSYIEVTVLGRGLDTPRWRMVSEYFHGMGVDDVVFGRDLSSLPFISLYDGNPHNSFIRGHSIMGGWFIVVLMASLLYAIYKLLVGFTFLRFVLFSIFILIMVRANFDSLFFYSIFDFILFYVFFVAVTNRERFE